LDREDNFNRDKDRDDKYDKYEKRLEIKSDEESDFDFGRSKYSNNKKDKKESKDNSKIEENRYGNNYHMEYKDYKDHKEQNMMKNHELGRGSNYTRFTLKDSFNSHNGINYENEGRGNNDKNLDEDRIKPSYLTSSLEREMNNKDYTSSKENNLEFNNSFKNRDFNSSKNSKNSKSSNLKNEIDNLDSEIKHLQNKLKIMINVNKK
jgi:hypothetical protein